jgi:hypothetical protein
MKRWWVRLIISYAIAGYLGTALAMKTFNLWNPSGTIVWVAWPEAAVLPLVWPYSWIALLVDTPVHPSIGSERWLFAFESFYYCAAFLLSYGLLSRFAPKPKVKGLCPACGYDLRATPERCPECGTVVKN